MPFTHTTVGPYEVEAHLLMLDYVPVDVYVDVHDGRGIEYTITGLSDEVDTIHVENLNNGVLVIRGTSATGITRRLTDIVPGESVSRVHVRVPKGAAVDVNRPLAETTIHDTYGELSVDLAGNASVTAGHVGDTDLVLRDNSSVSIDEVKGKLSITMYGSTGVHVSSHVHTTQPETNVLGAGDIFVNVAGRL